MFMMYETLMLAFIALIAPLFGKLAGYELRRKPFEFVAASGLFFFAHRCLWDSTSSRNFLDVDLELPGRNLLLHRLAGFVSLVRGNFLVYWVRTGGPIRTIDY